MTKLVTLTAIFVRQFVGLCSEIYQTATDLEAKYNFNYQKGLLYGQLGNTEMMISTFLDESYANPQNSILIQNQLSRFMSDDSDATLTSHRKVDCSGQKIKIFLEPLLELVLRPKKSFQAFIQKAIYKRNSESLSNIVNLANLA
jgi:hypothetical protein